MLASGKAGRVSSDPERVERFLGEFRMLVTAAGVLLAFQLQAVFSSAFHEAPALLQRVHLVGTLFGVAAFATLLLPASVHRIASQVEEAGSFIEFARRAIGWGFLLLAVSLILGVFVQAGRTLSIPWGVAASAATAAILGICWVVVPRWYATRRSR